MKKVGIVADNYKLEKFKKELTAKGFTDFTIMDYQKVNELSLIQVHCKDERVMEVKTICQNVELYFKRSN